MSFLTPVALALGLLAIPIILLYMLRLRRREQLVSSNLLWRDLVRDQAANAPWQRLRRNLLLFLQLLILAALVIALARPYLNIPGFSGGNTIILLDASASMQATDSELGRSRFDQAREEAGRIIGRNTDPVTLIKVGQIPTVLASATTDRVALARALEDSSPDNTAADWSSALTLAAASAQGSRDPRFIIISDGGLPETLPALPGDIDYIPIGRAGENSAVVAMAVRPTTGGDALLVGVQNMGESDQSSLLSIYLNGGLFDSRRITLSPGERKNINWTLPASDGFIEARLEAAAGTDDFLALDNHAWATMNTEIDRRVLLISEGNLFLERILAVLPGYQVFRAEPETANQIIEGTRDDGKGFDMIIYDGVALPNPLPDANLLIFNPQTSPATETSPANRQTDDLDIRVTGTFTDTNVTRVMAHPLLENVDWSTVNIGQAQAIQAPTLQPLVITDSGPLLIADETNNHRTVLFAFDLKQSDLPLQIAFPILMANITSWLSPGRVLTNRDLQPGDTLTITPDTRAEAILIVKPDGSREERRLDPITRSVEFADTQQPGYYEVFYRLRSGELTPVDSFVVNFFNPAESDILPRAAIRLGQADIQATPSELTGRRELWPWVLLIGFLVLLIEWLVSYPGMRKYSLPKLQ